MDKLKASEAENVLIVTSGMLANMLFGIEHALSNEEAFNRPIPNTDVFDFEL